MSEQTKRAEEVWANLLVWDGDEACIAGIAAALQEAERRGVEKIISKAREHSTWISNDRISMQFLEEETARLLSQKEGA